MVLVVFLFVAVLLPMAGVAAKGATVVEFKGTETMVELINPGDWSYPGDNFHVRNREWLAYEDALNNEPGEEKYNNSCVTGPSHVYVEVNINKNGSENYWGKWIVEPEAYDGTWEMTWRSRGDYIYASGHGTGVFTGMTTKWILDDNGGFEGTINIPPNAQVQCAE